MNNDGMLLPARRAWNRFFTAAVWVAAALVIVLVAGIIGYGAGAGHAPHHVWQFLTTTASVLKGTDRHPARHPQHTVCHSADITHRIAAGRGRGGLSDRVRHQPPPHSR